MSITVKYTAECDCGGQYEARSLDLSQEPGREVEVSLDMLEMTLRCSGCGESLWVPSPIDFAESSDD